MKTTITYVLMWQKRNCNQPVYWKQDFPQYPFADQAEPLMHLHCPVKKNNEIRKLDIEDDNIILNLIFHSISLFLSIPLSRVWCNTEARGSYGSGVWKGILQVNEAVMC